MAFGVIIDREKCNKDGICVSECPERAIEMGEDGFPRPTAVGEQQCINCGHCVAFCPEGAFSLETMTPEDCDRVPEEKGISVEQADPYFRSRRSIRTYKKKPVPRDVITHMIDLARYAPTAKNLEPVHWLVIYDADEVQRFGGMVIDWMRAMRSGERNAIFGPDLLDLIIKDTEGGGDWICRGAPHIVVASVPTICPYRHHSPDAPSPWPRSNWRPPPSMWGPVGPVISTRPLTTILPWNPLSGSRKTTAATGP